MDLQLKDKRALVTGSTAGIGYAIAKALAQEGARVIINGRSAERVEQAAGKLRDELGSTPDQLIGIAADVGTLEGCQDLAQRAQAAGAVDILVNNAGVFNPTPFEEIPDQEWLDVYRVNVLSGVRLSRLLMEAMKQRRWGRILFISSESAINIPTEMVQYGMTKTAQLAVARGLAKTLSATGVTVNSLLPGPTWSEGVAEFVGKLAQQQNTSPEQMKQDLVPQMRPSSLTQRFASVEEVAAMAAFLCSPPSSATTGAAVRVDGGVVNTCF